MEILPIYKTHLYRIISGKLVLISHDFLVGKIGFWALQTSIIVCLKCVMFEAKQKHTLSNFHLGPIYLQNTLLKPRFKNTL